MRFFNTRLVVSCFLLLLLGGCAGGQNVYFFPQADQSHLDRISKLHIDAFGNLYPSAGLPAEFDGDKKFGGGLYNLMVHPGMELCSGVQSATDAEALCDVAQKSPCNSAEVNCVATKLWRAQQKALWKKAAAADYQASHSQTNDPQIVILIHGYNNTEAEAAASYASVRQRILATSSTSEKLHFVEVYWDGFSSFTDWSKAQASGPLVGFHLRQFFNSLIDKYRSVGAVPPRLRVLTHSSGAFVIGATFGNPTRALPELQKTKNLDPDYEYFKQRAANRNSDLEPQYNVPQIPNLRIGMLAPATPSTTFSKNPNEGDESKRTRNQGLLIDGVEVLISINPKDKATNKYGLGADFPGSGSTGVAAKAKYYCDLLRYRENFAADNVQFFGFDFTRSDSDWGNEDTSHSFVLYAKQAQQNIPFFEILLSDKNTGSFSTQLKQHDPCG